MEQPQRIFFSQRKERICHYRKAASYLTQCEDLSKRYSSVLVADLFDKMSVENEPTESHLGSVGGRKDAERTKNQALK